MGKDGVIVPGRVHSKVRNHDEIQHKYHQRSIMSTIDLSESMTFYQNAS